MTRERFPVASPRGPGLCVARTCGYAQAMRTRGPTPEVGPLTRLSLALRQRVLRSQVGLLGVLVVLSGAVAAGIVLQSTWVPPSTYVVLLLVGVLLLRLRPFAVLSVVVLLEVLVLLLTDRPAMVPGVVVIIGIGAVVALVFASERDRLGLRGAPGGHMLVDLRDRLAAHGRVPVLPRGWRVDTEIRSAHSDAFSGDFLVARLRRGSVLEVVLLLYTDGLVDTPARSLDRGIDRLMGAADRVLGRQVGGAAAVLADVRADDSDDRARVLVCRD